MLYEIILKESECYLYPDIEMKAEENKLFTIEMTNFFISVVKMIVIEYICLAFPNHPLDHDQLKVYQASTNQKISIHVIHQDLTFDNHICSCASFVGVLNAMRW